jgi:hypothetical protein
MKHMMMVDMVTTPMVIQQAILSGGNILRRKNRMPTLERANTNVYNNSSMKKICAALADYPLKHKKTRC